MQNRSDNKTINLSRRRFLQSSAVLPFAATAGGCATVPASVLEYADTLISALPAAPIEGFDKVKAGEDLAVSVLPRIYKDKVLYRNLTPSDALEAIRKRLTLDAEFTLFRHDNVTAVVVNQPAKHRITVSYDSTDEWGDIRDNLWCKNHPHPLGGQVHEGYFDAIARKDKAGVKISDRITAQVEAYAATQYGTPDLHITGFSRGGALAIGQVAQWMTDGMPAKTKLTDVQTFSGCPYGDREFVKNFERKCKEKKIEVTRIISGADTVPNLLAEGSFIPGMNFVHAGKAVYMMPGKEKGTTEIFINPKPEELAKRLKNLERRNWHDTNLIGAMLGTREAYVDWKGTDSPEQLSKQRIEEMRRESTAMIAKHRM